MPSDKLIARQIETSADYYPPANYSGSGSESFLTYYNESVFSSDALADQYIALSAVNQRSRNSKMFVVGVIPPSANISNRILDRDIPGKVIDSNPTRNPNLSPNSTGTDELAARALEDVSIWKGHTETDPVGKELIRGYWTAIGQPGVTDTVKTAWSGAYISSRVNSVFPGALDLPHPENKPSGNHFFYTSAALRRKKLKTSGYWASDPAEGPAVRVGDIIVSSRGDTLTTWDDVKKGSTGIPNTHGDIVVKVEDGKVTVIGGNVDDTVRERTYALGTTGRLAGDGWVAVLRLSPDLQANLRPSLPVQSDALPGNFQAEGSAKASDAREIQEKIANTPLTDSDISAQYTKAQQAQIDIIAKTVEGMRNAPPLRLLVNPQSFSVKGEKIVSDANWSRNGNTIVEHWGNAQEKISASGKVAGFYAIDSLNASGPGLTRMARNYSQSWQNFQSLQLLYANNAGIYTLDSSSAERNLSMLGSIYIFYDDILYIGAFDSFNITENDATPFTAEYSFEFTVRAAFLVDNPNPNDRGTYGVGNSGAQSSAIQR